MNDETKLEKFLKCYSALTDEGKIFLEVIAEMALRVAEQPKVVRCRDCIKVDICCRRRTDNPDWYCADGERR